MGNMMRKQWNWELARMDFPGTWKEETKEPMFSYKQFSDVVVFFSLKEPVSFHAANKNRGNMCKRCGD